MVTTKFVLALKNYTSVTAFLRRSRRPVDWSRIEIVTFSYYLIDEDEVDLHSIPGRGASSATTVLL
jgi:hypothetical protein